MADFWEDVKRAYEKPDARPVATAERRTAEEDTAYGKAAARRAYEELERTIEGGRNHALNIAACGLGNLVAGGELTEDSARSALEAGALANGLTDDDGEHSVQATINSGLRKGMETPRSAPEQPDSGSSPKFEEVFAGFATTENPENGGEQHADITADHIRQYLPRVDWHALWADNDEEEWIISPLLPARRLIALYSAPKVGKSLLMLELAVAISRGATALGHAIDRPRNVLYVDFENDPRGDVRARLQAMGLGPDDLAGLCYLSFPTLAALDTEKGARELLAAIEAYRCEVVIIDTVSRSVEGDENENDTWLAFYRHTGLRLKQAGVAMIRLDHAGKDETKGQRGGSAKVGDVDAVWRLTRVTSGENAPETFRLICEANRFPIPVADKLITIERLESPHLHHQVNAMGARDAVVSELRAWLKSGDVDLAADVRRVIWPAAKGAGINASLDRVRDVVNTLRAVDNPVDAWHAEGS